MGTLSCSITLIVLPEGAGSERQALVCSYFGIKILFHVGNCYFQFTCSRPQMLLLMQLLLFRNKNIIPDLKLFFRLCLFSALSLVPCTEFAFQNKNFIPV